MIKNNSQPTPHQTRGNETKDHNNCKDDSDSSGADLPVYSYALVFFLVFKTHTYVFPDKIRASCGNLAFFLVFLSP